MRPAGMIWLDADSKPKYAMAKDNKAILHEDENGLYNIMVFTAARNTPEGSINRDAAKSLHPINRKWRETH
jgi:hypothetical protein